MPEELEQRMVEGAPRVEGEPARVAYRSWEPPLGQPARTPVLLLHGSPGSGANFRGMGPLLGLDRPVVAPDLPGFGHSSRRAPDYSIRAHAAVALQLLDSLGIHRAHLVGFSLGGGVALEMYRADPDRIASLTMLAAIGVQEWELLGDYHLNHSIHGLQLAGLWALHNLLPHFGALDDAFLSYEYARNFYDTDQRPLREILQGFAPPMLILHGARDPLVPIGAAREHHRIVAHSEFVELPTDHFVVFTDPASVATPIAAFLKRVDEGDAPDSGSAAQARLLRAMEPLAPEDLPKAEGFGLFVALALLMLATLVSEDLAGIGGGLLIARGVLPWGATMFVFFFGLVAGDMLLYLVGRVAGGRIAASRRISRLLPRERIEEARAWFGKRAFALVIGGRFVPGARLPTYLAAGAARYNALFFFCAVLAGTLLWAPLLVGGSALFGSAMAERFHVFQENALLWVVSVVAFALILTRLLIPFFSRMWRRG